MKRCFYWFCLLAMGPLVACNSSEWEKSTTLHLGDVQPVGLAYLGGQVWVSDIANNRLVAFSTAGKQLASYDGLDRPMHIDTDGEAIYVPEYGVDKVTRLHGDERSVLLLDSLKMPAQEVYRMDAPAGVGLFNSEVAIADFYNHRILYFDGDRWEHYGEYGAGKGQFKYPTDVQITKNRIYAADSYNNRVHIMEKSGRVIKMIGAKESMNAVTGIYVTDKQIIVTDFEHNRVLIYTLNGWLVQILDDGLNKPSDVLVVDGVLYVANRGSHSLAVYRSKGS